MVGAGAAPLLPLLLLPLPSWLRLLLLLLLLLVGPVMGMGGWRSCEGWWRGS